LTGAETVVDIWLHYGSDCGIVNGENDAGSTEESASAGRNDALEHMSAALKVEDSINSPSFGKVSESLSEKKFHGLIEPKLEQEDDSDLMSSCDDTSRPDVPGQGAQNSCNITSSPLDHDYFGVMNVNVKTEREDGCELVQSLPGCESAQSLATCELVESLPGPESVQSMAACELEGSLPDCKSSQSLLCSTQATMSEECVDVSKVKSSVATDGSVRNNVLEGAPVMQKHKMTNPIPPISELLAQTKTVSNHVAGQNVPLAQNNSKLGTLMKCIDKSGRVFFVTVGRTNVKSQLKLASVVPKLEQSVHVPNLTSLLIKPPPNTLLQNKLSPTLVAISESSEHSPTPRSQPNSYCKVKGSGTSEDNFGLIPSQTNSSVLVTTQGSAGNGVTTQASVHSLLSVGANSSVPVTTQGSAGNGVTTQASVHSLLSVGANSSGFITSKGLSLVTPMSSMNLKPGVKVTSPVILVKNSPEVRTQLQSGSGQTLSFVKPNKNVLAADKLEEGNKLGALKDVIISSAQNKSISVQDQSLLIAKNCRLYLLKHPQSAVTLSALTAKSGSKKFDSVPRQQETLLPDAVRGGQSLLLNPVHSAKAGVSLLKKHTNAVVLPAVEKPQNIDKSEDARLLMSGRTLVLNKGNSRQITHSDRMCYLEDLK
jgi:hypothetical protein